MQNRFINSFIFSLLCCTLSLFSCKQDFSPQDTKSLQLTEESVEVTEAWLKLSALPPDSRSTYVVKRDTHIVFSGKLDIADTIIHDRNLEPNKDYAYRAWREVNGEKTGSTARLNITTMDTTSHNFSWQTYEFGAKSSSVFYDVAIIDENDIWAVGIIYTEDTYTYDSLGNWIEPYNAAHWDGEKWELKRIKTNACGGVDYPAIKAIFSFSYNDILFAHIDGSITHFDGKKFINDCSLVTELKGSANKMWGLSKDDLFVVSGNGFIAHYNGQSWQKIESGTTQPIRDIWGVKDSVTESIIVMAIASNIYQGGEKKVLSIDDMSVTNINIRGLPWALSGVWFCRNNYYISGDGLFKRKCLECSVGWQRFDIGLTNYFSHAIRGYGVDIVVAGAFGEIITFNGMTWKNHLSNTYMSSGSFYSVAISLNLITAVGHKNFKGCVLIGRRF